MRAIFVDCTPELRQVISKRSLQVPPSLLVNDGSPSEAELVDLCGGADVILTEHTAIRPAMLDACPSIRGIVFMGTGAGTYVDLEDAQRRGIPVVTTPGYGDRAVAEHALALMLSGARRISRMDREIRAGHWQPLGGLQLHGRKLAVVGMGGIGTALAEMAAALGMQVMGWNRSHRDHPLFVPTLDAALEGADVVSLHLALNGETQGIIGGRQLHLPNKGFLLVNTARAELVEEAALLAALENGQIGHAALDVFPHEPIPADNPYVTQDNVTLTAHAAYMTDDAYAELWARSIGALNSLHQR